MNKDESVKIKGIALLLMFWHHFFGFGSFLLASETTWKPIFSQSAVTALGIAGKLCIPLFLFCSGYGLYKSFISAEHVEAKSYLLRFLKVLIPYWVINALIAIPYLIATGNFHVSYLLPNILALLHNDEMLYVSFSWYVKLYVCILIALPIIRVLEKKWKKHVFIDVLIYIVLPIACAYYFRDFIREDVYLGVGRFLLSTILMVASYIPVFYCGMLFSKYNLFSKLIYKGNSTGKRIATLVIALAAFIFILFIRSVINVWDGRITDIVYTPIGVIALLNIFNNVKYQRLYVLTFIGRYSFEYWLLSGMFFLNTIELQWIAFWPQYSVLIMIWSLLILTPFAILCRWVSEKILMVIQKYLYNVMEKA